MAQQRRIIPRGVVATHTEIESPPKRSAVPANENMTAKEADIKRAEELNKAEEKVLDEKAKILRKKAELKAMEAGEEPSDPNGIFGDPWAERPGSAAIDEHLQSVLDELDAEARFVVFRIDGTKKYKVGVFPITEWPDRMEEVARVTGGGHFMITFKSVDNTTVKTITQAFDPSFYKKSESGTGDLSSVLAQMNQSNMAVLESMRRENMEMLKTIITTMGAGNRGGFLQSAQDIALIGQMFQNKGADSAGVMETFLKGLEMGRTLNPDREPPSTFDKLVDTIGKPVAEALGKAAQNPAVPQMPHVPRVAAPAIEPKPTVETSPMQAIKNSFAYKMYVPQILAAAKSDASVDEWAERIVGTVPEAYDGVLIDVCSRVDVVDYLAQFESDVRSTAGWFARLSKAILDKFDGDETPDEKTVGDEIPAVAVNGKELKE